MLNLQVIDKLNKNDFIFKKSTVLKLQKNKLELLYLESIFMDKPET